jgi:hypothetical protein
MHVYFVLNIYISVRFCYECIPCEKLLRGSNSWECKDFLFTLEGCSESRYTGNHPLDFSTEVLRIAQDIKKYISCLRNVIWSILDKVELRCTIRSLVHPSSVFWWPSSHTRSGIAIAGVIIRYLIACLPLDPKFAGSNLAEDDGILRVMHIHSTTSFVGEVKPSVTCRRFTTCKRTLRAWKRCLVSKIQRPCFLPISLLLRY